MVRVITIRLEEYITKPARRIQKRMICLALTLYNPFVNLQQKILLVKSLQAIEFGKFVSFLLQN